MHTFKGFVTKEFYHIFRDKRSMLILFGMPIIQLILFGFAIRNELTQAHIAVLDHSKDAVTRELIHKIDASKYFTVSDELQNADQIKPAFQRGKIKEVIVLEPHFSRTLRRDGQAHVQLVTDATDPNMAQMVSEYTQAIISDYQQSLDQPGIIQAETMIPKTVMLFNPQLKSVNLFVPGLIAVILMLISALMTSISITREKEMGTMEVLLVSPLKPYQIIVGKVIPYMVLSLVNVLTVLILARTIFGVPFRGSFVLFMFEALLFILTALSLGLFISTISNNQQTAMMVSLAGLLLPTVILSGFIFPISSMPWILQMLSRIIPARWFLVIVRGIMLKGIGLQYLWKETLILGGMTLFFIVLSVRNFKIRLD